MGLFFNSDKALTDSWKREMEASERNIVNILDSNKRFKETMDMMEAHVTKWQKEYWRVARELAELKGEEYKPDWREGLE